MNNFKKAFGCLLLFLFITAAQTSVFAQISVSANNTPIKQVIRQIEKSSGYSFFYSDDALDTDRKITVNIKNESIEAALNKVFAGTNISYAAGKDKQILLTTAENDKPVTRTSPKYSGTVIDDKGESVIGASITVKGTSAGTVTDADGKFSIEAPTGSTLSVSYIGYTTQEIKLENQSDLLINLKEDSKMLDEVVVVGYGTQKKTHLSGAISTISSKAIANRPVTNANFALQGLAPNVNIASTSGNPMQTPEPNVRGYSSINGGNALILVDNVPMNGGDFARLNPADIESISVLKDAASAAIYGARAAYGVILVTTKTAKSNKLEINADLNYGVRRELTKYKFDYDLPYMMETINLVSGDPEYNAAQIDYARQRMANPSLPEVRLPASHPMADPNFLSLDSEDKYDYYAFTDWHDLITRKAPSTTTANVSVGQRTERLSFLTSMGFYRAEGIYVGDNPMKRYNIKLSGSYKLFDWWSVGASASYARTEQDSPFILGHRGAKSDLSSDYSWGRHGIARTYMKNPIKNPDGTWTESAARLLGSLTEGGRYVANQNQTLLLMNTQFDIIKDIFFIKGDASINVYNAHADTWELPVPWTRGYGFDRDGVIANARYDGWDNIRTVFNVYGDFHKTFGGKHFVQALAGFNQEHVSETNAWVKQDELMNDAFPTIALATGAMTRGQGINALSLRGAFGRLNYTFDNRYIVEFNGRYDGTSRYAKGHRFGFFPSITGAWIASNEKFMEPVKDLLKISFLKFRGSYGSLGNQSSNDGYYPYFSTMINAGVLVDRLIDGNRPRSIARPDREAASNLTWETVRTVNFGGNLGLFNNRLTIEFDKYTRYTEGMMADAMPIPKQFGSDVARTNSADLKTKGWEFDLTWRDEIEGLAGSPFSYSVRVMIADSRAWITKYSTNPTKLFDTWYEGKEVGELWGYEVPGLFQSDAEAQLWHDQNPIKKDSRTEWAAGDMKFNDLNGDGKIDQGKNTVDDPGDRRIVGNSQARIPYSFDINAGWKGFDLRVFFQGIGKRDWYPYRNTPGAQEFWSNYFDTWESPSAYIRDYWTPENPNGYYPRRFPRFAGGEWSGINTRYMQDASYLRLKNLTAGYTLPKNLTAKWGVGRLRVYFSGENLWTLSHMHVDAIDPEVVGYGDNTTMYPMQKVFSLGFNLGF